VASSDNQLLTTSTSEGHMFGVLLESRARRHRRTGGAALSIAAHIAIIGAATAATVHGKASSHAPPKPVFLVFKPAPAPKHVDAGTTVSRPTPSRDAIPRPVVLTIPALSTTPPSLPTIDLSHDPTPDVVKIGGPASDGRTGRPGGKFDLIEEPTNSGEWRGRELLMHIVSSVKPRYPETLRQNGIDGRVLVQFTVDTTGRVDMASIRVVQSTHDQFTQAVRSALASFRFRPAEVNGKRTAALAEMPFEFQIR
jgi:TonB family protein